MTIKRWTKKLAAIVLTVAVLAVSIPCAMLQVSAKGYDRVSDPSTMNDWKLYFGKDVLSTENAGGVWVDKSVFTDSVAFDGTGITLSDDGDNFLVALSAMASNTEIKGLSNTPTDVMLVLDLSSAMHHTSAALQAVNETIEALQQQGRYNRVGVITFDGVSARVLLELDRYTYAGRDTAYSFLKPTIRNGALVSVDVNTQVMGASGETVTASHVITDASGSYTQSGLLKALENMLAADPQISPTSAYFAGQTRIPALVLLLDGEPTVATAAYTKQETASIGTAGNTDNAAQKRFVTQLTAAYVKEKLQEHYEGSDALLYTVAFSDEPCMDIVNPYSSDRLSSAILKDTVAYTDAQIEAAKINRAIDGYWDVLVSDGKVEITVQGGEVYTVSAASLEQGIAFPHEKAQKYYVDEAFTVTQTSELLRSIDLQSRYFPTLVDGDEEISGYISFNDRIGEHMSITEIKGILIDDVLFSGAMLSKNFVTGGGELGTFDEPTSLGDELVWAVKARLGVDADTARDLLGLAYYHGQLRYNTESDFSNYIGWYANAAGEFLGFWYDGITTMPDPADPSLTDATRPAYIVRSYGFLGEVDEEHGVAESDMMYATVQIRENIVSGDEEMLFSIPASLIPTVTYEIALDENDAIESFAVGGAEHPIRLVYEVSLDDEIDPLTLHKLIKDGDVHQNDDGSVSFYSNAFETDNTVGYGKRNTYCYFTPSRQNARYYYTENAMIYADTNGTVYQGEKPDRDAVLYRAFDVYTYENAPIVESVYERISPDSLEKAVASDDGWYIPAGTIHTMLENYVTDKLGNPTDTLPYSHVPFVDTQYTYYVGATLGNNGCLTVEPATGMLIENAVQGGETAQCFAFTITRTDVAENAAYNAVLYTADGTSSEQTVSFKNGTAEVTLAQAEALYIFGMSDGASYTVRETEPSDYRLVSVNGDASLTQAEMTIKAKELAAASFENARKGYGDVVIVNRITHDFGASYVIPDIRFTYLVELPAEYAETVIAVEHSEDSAMTSVKTDENGRFTIMLGHAGRFELVGLREGTVVTATQIDTPRGFTPVYYGAGVQDASAVTIRKNASISIVVANVYAYDEVSEVNISVDGIKHLIGRENDEWLDSDRYSFELQRYTDGKWETIATDTVDKNDASFSFTEAMKAERFTKSGIYSYQIIETSGDVEGVLYDQSIHTFSVVVGDRGMCGQLHILDVISHHKNVIVSGNDNDGFTVTTDFTNLCTSAERADAVIDIENHIDNPSGSDLVSLSGLRFGLFGEDDTMPVFVSDPTDMIGEARLIATFDTVGTYTYTLKELIPEETVAGMRYSDETYTVVVNVVKTENGTLRAIASVSKDEQAIDGIPVFTNTYAPSEASLLPEVYTKLTGRELRDGEFTVHIQEGDKVLATGTNTPDGAFVFDQPMVFGIVGDYYYDVIEIEGDVKGIEYDPMIYRLHVSVTDSGNGALTAHYHVINTVTDTITFKNFYYPAPTKLVVSGVKHLIGRELINEEFSFVLVNGRTILSTSNFTDGTFRFEPITFYEVGEYALSVFEVQESIAHGIEFDDTAYHLSVSVTDSGDGVLNAEATITCNDEEVKEIVFTNYYTTTPAQLTLEGVLYLDGRDLASGELFAQLYETDMSWAIDRPLETIAGDENGVFQFAPLTFEADGVYRYVVKVQNSGETIDGITYDAQFYRVLIVVTDNHRGTLSATATILDSSNAYAEEMAFYNTYETPTTSTETTTTTTTVSDVPVTTTTAPSTTSSTKESTTTTVSLTTSTTATTNPPTGESDEAVLWLAALIVSSGVLAMLALRRKQEP